VLISIRHVTRFSYAAPVGYAVQSLRLTPASFRGHRVLAWDVRVPGAGPALQFTDGDGNLVHNVTVATQHHGLTIEAGGTVETSDRNGVVDGLAIAPPPRVYLRQTAQTRAVPAIRELAQAAVRPDTIGQLHALSAVIRDGVGYVPGTTDAQTTAADALAAGRGVCQDHAHIFIAAARCLGIPARYVTGYLLLEKALPSPAHHAWAEAWVEGLGWVGFDITNGICPTERYVRLATGLDAKAAAPITGSRRGGDAEQLDVCVLVQQQSVQQ
jgi:transglutaminase-like putative cysteine protease